MSDLLTDKKLKWAERQKPKMIKGSTLNYNAAVGSRYDAEIQALISQMTAQVEREIKKFFGEKKVEEFFAEDASIAERASALMEKMTSTFSDLFSKKSSVIAKRMVKDSSKSSKAALTKSMGDLTGGLSLNTGIVPDDLSESFQALVSANVQLIKSIPNDYLAGVQGAVMRSISSGGTGLQELIPYMQKHKEITQRHARNVALDQTRKAFNAANSERMQSLGVEEFEWIHSGGGAHPREDHIKMSGKTFRFDDPPVIGVMYGNEVRGLPGDLPNCRCTMKPVIKFKE